MGVEVAIQHPLTLKGFAKLPNVVDFVIPIDQHVHLGGLVGHHANLTH